MRLATSSMSWNLSACDSDRGEWKQVAAVVQATANRATITQIGQERRATDVDMGTSWRIEEKDCNGGHHPMQGQLRSTNDLFRRRARPRKPRRNKAFAAFGTGAATRFGSKN